jgi:hypothetical protein
VASPASFGEREVTIVDLAMFDAVNSLARKYRPYLVREDGFNGASAEAAAASAAATVLEKLHPQTAADFKSALDDYVKGLSPSRDDVAKGVQLGELVALRVFDSRAADGATGVDTYRPRTQPGARPYSRALVLPPHCNDSCIAPPISLTLRDRTGRDGGGLLGCHRTRVSRSTDHRDQIGFR